jgi:uncharacterized membrane protein YkoI
MNKKYIIWMLAGMLILVVVILAGRQWFQATMVSAITEEEAQQIVEEKYPGKLLKLEANEQQFIVDIKRDTGNYRILVDEKSGEILSVKRIEEQKPVEGMTPLSEDEIREIILQQVPGTILKMNPTKQGETIFYEAVVEENQQQQKITINGLSGEIMEKSPVKVEDNTKRLTEKEAADIALAHVPGTIDDIDMENINGMNYYLVEVEADEENEAVVAINAITGEVQSVTWDD